jgi:hypothetical protein
MRGKAVGSGTGWGEQAGFLAIDDADALRGDLPSGVEGCAPGRGAIQLRISVRIARLWGLQCWRFSLADHVGGP